jgi:hypothetical protein
MISKIGERIAPLALSRISLAMLGTDLNHGPPGAVALYHLRGSPLRIERVSQPVEKGNLRRLYFSPRNFFYEEFRAIDFRKLLELS